MTDNKVLVKLTQRQKESRDYNIITCQNRSASTNHGLPPLRKLGLTQDWNNCPFDRQKVVPAKQIEGSFRQTASLVNASSVKFNFVSLTQQNKQQALKEMKQEHPEITHKKKGGMAEVADLGGLCYPNFNREYQETFKQNSNVFRRSKGMWPSVQQKQFTYGPFMKPFKHLKF